MKRWGLAAGGMAAGLLAGFLVWGPGAGIVAAPAAPSASELGNEELLAPARPAASANELDGPAPAAGEGAQHERLREDLAREVARSAALEVQILELQQQLEAPPPEAGAPDREPGTAESAATEGEGAPRTGWIGRQRHPIYECRPPRRHRNGRRRPMPTTRLLTRAS